MSTILIKKTSISYDVQRSFDGFRCILSRYLDHRTALCILINYPEICNAYGSLVNFHATKTPHIYMSGCTVCLCLDSISSISNSLFIFLLFYSPLSLIHNNICIWSVLLSFHAFSLCLSLSGKPYKMCRLKLMYNRWSSRLQVTDGGVMDFKMSYCWYTE